MPDCPALYTPIEVASLLRLKLAQVYRLIRKQQLPAVRIGRQLRIPRSKLLDVMGADLEPRP
jgi:excisionase family DNA binding protein